MCTLPQLIAACHVLHRLEVPRHPPCALSSLTVKLIHKQLLWWKLVNACTVLLLQWTYSHIAPQIIEDSILSKFTLQFLPRSIFSYFSLFDCQRPLQFEHHKDIQNSTFTIIKAQYWMSQQTVFMEARGLEPLTSGMQILRSAKLSYAPFAERRKKKLRGQDLNLWPLGYAYHYGFRRLFIVCGLDFPFILDFTLGCLPTSLYTFSKPFRFRAWLGITSLTASPNLTGKRIQVSLYAAHCETESQALR